MTIFSQGTYVYLHNGKETDIQETWVKEISSDSTRIVSRRDAPPYKSRIEVNYWSRAHEPTRIEIKWLNGTAQNIPERQVEYSVSQNRLRVIYSASDEEIKREEYTITEDMLISPLLRIFVGSTIRTIHAQNGQGTVIVPNITSPRDPELLLKPSFEQRRVHFLGNAMISVPSGTYHTECFGYVGSNHDQNARFWLYGDTLVRYTFDQWDVQLG